MRKDEKELYEVARRKSEELEEEFVTVGSMDESKRPADYNERGRFCRLLHGFYFVDVRIL